MPLATSHDNGKTWTKSRLPFDPLASGERPSVIRLLDGKLFFTGDYNPKNQKHLHVDGAYAALSDDDGKTWTIKRLPENILTVGYTTATQGPDGVIHIATTKNKVNVEIELNEAWVLDKSAGEIAPVTGTLTEKQHHTAKYPNGKPRAEWSTARTPDGRLVLDGTERFFYPSGKLQYTATFAAGLKNGEERWLREDGTPYWVKQHNAADRTWTWQLFDPAGKVTATSHWRNKTLLDSTAPDAPADKLPGQDKLGPPEGL